MPTVTNNIIVSSVGASVLNTTDPSSVSWIRVNADNTITYRSAAQTLSDLGAQAAGTYLVPADIGVTVQGYNANTTILGNSTTGSGSIVLATSPTIATSLILDYGTASTVVYLNASKQLISLANGTGVLTNNGSGTLTWAAVAGGISIGDTIGNSPVTGSVLMAIGTTLTQSISYRAQQATPFLTAFGFESANSGSFSGVNNTFYGWRAGKLNTTGTDNLFSGFEAGSANTTGSRNLYLGSWISGDMTATATKSDNIGAGYRSLTLAVGGQNVAVGNNAAQSVGVGNTATGYNSMALSNNAATYNTCSGHNSGSGITGSFNSLCGVSTSSATFSFSGGFGFFSTNTANNQLMLGGSNAGFGGYNDVCIGNGNTNSSAASVILRVTSGSGTNNAGGNLIEQAGAATGTAIGGYHKTRTSVPTSSGTTLQTQTDRHVIMGCWIDITSGVTTTFGRIALATKNTSCSGEILISVEVFDGTDIQNFVNTVKYSVTNKEGTVTATVTPALTQTAEQISNCTSGTLTGQFTISISGTNAQLDINAVSSLSPTTMRISHQVLNNMGVASIVSP